MYSKILKKESSLINEKIKVREEILKIFKPGSIHKCYRNSDKGYEVEIMQNQRFPELQYSLGRTSHIHVKNLKTNSIRCVWWQELLPRSERRTLWSTVPSDRS